jgi:hypothetical protein
VCYPLVFHHPSFTISSLISHIDLSNMPCGVRPPFSVILSWPKSNYDDPESQGDGIVAVSLFLAITAAILVSLRLYTRIFLIRQPGLDDVLIILGLVRSPPTSPPRQSLTSVQIFAILLTALVLTGYYHYGVGIHIWDLRLQKAAHARFVRATRPPQQCLL